jgi:predicted nucleic acid-binding protein
MREAIVDANVLLRYLTDEPREQADRAAAILETAHQRRIDLLVTPLTLAEVVFVLESVYHWDRAAISDGLRDLISSSVLRILESDTLVHALEWYRDFPAVHFADAYVAAVAASRGHGAVVSFDRGLRRVPGLSIVKDIESLDADR